MEYTITTVGPYPPAQRTVVSVEMTYRDWCLLEKSNQWKNLEKFLDNLEKQRSHLSRQEKI
jgi:hypothetical protein